MNILNNLTKGGIFAGLEEPPVTDPKELNYIVLWRSVLDRALLDLKNKETRQEVLDWLSSPEFEEICEYARFETHFCLKIFNKVKEELGL